MIAYYNGSVAFTVVCIRAAWEKLLPILLHNRPLVDLAKPRASSYPGKHSDDLQSCLLLYHGGSKAGTFRRITPLKWCDDDGTLDEMTQSQQQIFWARDDNDFLVKQFHISLTSRVEPMPP